MVHRNSPNVGAKCGGHSSRKTGQKCSNPAGWGTDHAGYGNCKHHGGSTRTGIIAAEKHRLQHRGQLFGEIVAVDPGQSLLNEVYRGAAFIRYLEQLLTDNGIDEDARTDPQQLLLELTEDGYKSRAWVIVWQKERENHARVCKMALDANIAERQVNMMQQFADQVGDLVYGLIQDLGLNPEDAKVRTIARNRLIGISRTLQSAG